MIMKYFFREVSLQVFHNSFAIAYDRDSLAVN